MRPRIVGGSDYDNPYGQPGPGMGRDKLADTIFESFTQTRKPVDPPVSEIIAEFQEAQRRQSAPRPRKGAQT